MWCKNVGTSFCPFVTNHEFYGQTNRQRDGQTALPWIDRPAFNAAR